MIPLYGHYGTRTRPVSDPDVALTADDQVVAKMRSWCGRGVASVWIYQDHTSGYTIFYLYIALLYSASCSSHNNISDVPSSISGELFLIIHVYTQAPCSHCVYYRNPRYRIVSFAYDESGLTVHSRKYMYFLLPLLLCLWQDVWRVIKTRPSLFWWNTITFKRQNVSMIMIHYYCMF